MDKEDKSPEEIQKCYNRIKKHETIQFFLVPLLPIGLIVGAVTDFSTIFRLYMIAIVVYLVWVRVAVYKCPWCGHIFSNHEMWLCECKNCKAKFQ